MMIEPVESTFRARMKALAHRGGAVTKRRYANQPEHYREIGRRGGAASVATRKAKIAAQLESAPIVGAPITEPTRSLADAPDAAPRPSITIADILADCERFGPYRAEVSERQRILDAIAEERMARVIAGVYDGNEPEPWDPWP